MHTQHDIRDFSEVSPTGRRTSAVETDIQSDDEAEWAFLADPFIGDWVEEMYAQTMAIKATHTARAVAGTLNPEQLRKIQAIIEFLRDVERTDNDLSHSW